jgi:putative phosphoesterase
LEKLKGIMLESDFIIHLGDHYSDMRPFEKEIYKKLYTVKGNCDGGGLDEILEVDGYKILLTHGDKYGVKSSLYKLLLRAKELGVNAVFYGHTHIANVEEIDGITFVNPGNMQSFIEKSYCYAVLHNGKLIAKTVTIN